MADKTILIVEDEADIRELVSYNLTRQHFKVIEAEDGERALQMVKQGKPHLVILDLMLPGLSGLGFCRVLRGEAKTAQLPILMLTAKAGEVDRVIGLEMGADDYLTKPFSPRELVARVKAILRRTEIQDIPPGADLFEKGPLKIDYSTYEVSVKGKPVKLTLKEFELLRFLVQNPNRVLSRDRLQQLLINLIDNAIKYAPAEGEVKVTAQLTTPTEDSERRMVELPVSDKGAVSRKRISPD